MLILKRILFVLVLTIVMVFIAGAIMGWMNPTFHYQVQIEINAPIGEVFSAYTDDAKQKDWVKNFKRLDPLNENAQTASVGATYNFVTERKGEELIMKKTITTIDSPKRYAFTLENDFIVSHVDVHFSEKNGKTSIVEVSDGGGKGLFARALLKSAESGIIKDRQNMLNNLKKMVEN